MQDFLETVLPNITKSEHLQKTRVTCNLQKRLFCAFILSPCVNHYNDVIMDTMASQITSLTVVYLVIYTSADKTKHQSSALLAFVRGIHRGPVNFPHKRPVTRKMFPFDDVIMFSGHDKI